MAELMVPVAARGSVVAHSCNVNALRRFMWLQGSVAMLEFEPLFPQTRTGLLAKEAAAELAAAGFNIGPDESNIEHPTQAAFALAERLTGVQVTPVLLNSASFRAGIVSLRTHRD